MAIGGGTSLTDDRDPRLDAFILGLAGKARPRVCYLGTASGDQERGLLAFYRFFAVTVLRLYLAGRRAERRATPRR